MRFWPIFFLALLAGCGSRTKVTKFDDSVSLGQFRKLAVVPFADARGQGRAIAEDVGGQLRRIGHAIVDTDAVLAIVKAPKNGGDVTLGLETLELLRSKTGADAIILGNMAGDWSQATVTVVETELGDPVLRAIVRPRERRRAAFIRREEIVERTAAALISGK